MSPQAHEASQIFIELGAAIVSLALLGRLASRIGFSSIPLYLLLGLAFGNGGLAPLKVSEEFIHVGAEIGVLLLLFMLGLEYTGEELKHHLRTMLPAGAVDLALNFPPGLIAGLLLGWSPLASLLLGGVTYISSSGIIAKVLAELKRLDEPETTSIVSVLVLEDLAMAGPIAEKSQRLLGPLRDLFAATFFFFFGLEIDPKALPPVMPVAIALGVVSALTKVLTGYWAGGRAGLDRRGRIRAGMTLVARGEFSIVIAGLGAGISPLLGPVAAAYVLFLAVLGPILARVSP